MNIPPAKKIVCITGTVWTGSRSAPRRMLVREGLLRPIWFTTGRPVSDAQYEVISKTDYHLAQADSEVLAQMKYGGDFVGILKQDFEDAAIGAQVGVLVAGFPEIVAQIAKALPQAVIFALKGRGMKLSDHLGESARSGQLHRLDVNVLEPGAWSDVHLSILRTIGLPLQLPRSI
jgi:hypothetical protein